LGEDLNYLRGWAWEDGYVTTRISTDSAGNQATGGSSEVTALSADGRFVAFNSGATNLVAGDTNGQIDSFIKDTVTGVTTRISTDSAGNQATGGISYVTAISADGRYAAFWSEASNLVVGDTNGGIDSFIKDTVTGVTTRISVSSTGAEGNDGPFGDGSYSYVRALSADGRYAAFDSQSTNLVANDTNDYGDAFIRDLTKTGVQTLSGVVISNKASAKVTLDLAQRYRAELLDYRSKLGATTSRIVTFVNTLQSSTINYKAASSRIIDADIAEEAAKSIASGIRQQVASSLLAQANQSPQIGLQLLRNA
jgi:flagellin-like hook-associated protein FlgL